MTVKDSKRASIPEPSGLPFIGNVREFKSEDSLQDFDRLHNTYGEIFRLRFPGLGSCVFVGSHKLVNELCDEMRFKKSVQAELTQARLAAGDGLFTARTEEVNWGLAHRILVPAFGPMAIKEMFDEMYDVATQMALKWARYGPSNPIPASEDFTRMTLDTIALCSMGYRFNSFYKEEVHPFVHSMTESLVEIGNRSRRPEWANIFFPLSERKLDKDIKLMRRVSDELVQARKADQSGNKRRDLLTAMIVGVDPKTGQKLSDENIINNLVTFLVAGHETTSGTLSFAFYSMLKNPHTYKKAQEEVDAIMGRDAITVDKLSKLKYIPAVLRETLRQCSPIPGITFEALEDSLLDGKYPVKKGEPIAAMFSRSHLDPAVFGENAREFEPERMLDENFERLQKEFPNCWKPFGNGMRACIGRPFAWQEMLLTMALLLQNFDFKEHDPAYKLKIAESLTVKPKDFFMRASPRHGMTPVSLERSLRGIKDEEPVSGLGKASPTGQNGNGDAAAKPISIFYGSNSGTCEALGRQLASVASANGFHASTLDTLDEARSRLSADHPVVVITASYEGEPPDNARSFVSWLKSLSGTELAGVPFAVFGVGNAEWVQTFHRIPKLVDERLGSLGGERIIHMGLTDVSERDPALDFEAWQDSILWPALKAKYSVFQTGDSTTTPNLVVDVSTQRHSILRQDVQEAVLTATKDLAVPKHEKMHVEIALPEGMSYQPGDYLTVLPMNPRETVSRVLRRFKLPHDALLTIQGEKNMPLPTGVPVSALDILTSYVELSQPATRRNVVDLATIAQSHDDKSALESIAEVARFERDVFKKRISVLDILEMHPRVEIPVGKFLSMLPPLRTRQYSISSSPLPDPLKVSLTFSILEEPAIRGQGKHIGVATSYLAGLTPGDRLYVSVRPSTAAFKLPLNAADTPIICIAAGSGLAPFRGFFQHRSIQKKSRKALAPALLIFGCRGQGNDLYRDEFDTWEAEGVVTVKRAYSRQTEATAGCRYVQHRMLEQKEALFKLWERGAKIYVCGKRQLGSEVEAAFVEILKELKGVDRASAAKILDKERNVRFVMDIFD
ncbi:unnamed protein product [Clonostachys rosea]|uniref:Bifunctional cytochrome P450/NADPH--P450 reductase n=1 Tax=Bionectria ochroleuca TaxID=29856 RepID=A0ABY6U4J4_BIOOC|nr:unnamed protein product [Clonostachys rosea]